MTETAQHLAPPIRVLITVGDELGREGLQVLLSTEPNLRVVGQASSSPEVMELCRALQTDVLVLDLQLPGQQGCRTLQAVRREFSGLRVVVLSTRDHPEDLACARSAGAGGYLLKDELRGRLAAAISEVYAGSKYFSENARERSTV